MTWLVRSDPFQHGMAQPRAHLLTILHLDDGEQTAEATLRVE